VGALADTLIIFLRYRDATVEGIGEYLIIFFTFNVIFYVLYIFYVFLRFALHVFTYTNTNINNNINGNGKNKKILEFNLQIYIHFFIHY